MKYYVNIMDNKINGCSQCECTSEGLTQIEITKEVFDNIDRYEYKNGKIVEIENYEEVVKRREREEALKLTMTSLDLIGYLQKEGLTLEQINTFLEANLALKMQLTFCQNVYCGVVCNLCPIEIAGTKLDETKVIGWFKDKNNF